MMETQVEARGRRGERLWSRGRRGLSLVVVIATMSSAGCSAAKEAINEKVTEAAIEAGSNGEVDIDDDGTFSIETDDGSLEATSGSVPDAWPTDIPLPGAMSNLSSTEFSDASGESIITLTGTTASSIDDVERLYDDAFGSWDETLRSRSAANGSASLQVGYELDSRSVYIVVSDSADGTILTVSATGGVT